jgi:hypothetical protein
MGKIVLTYDQLELRPALWNELNLLSQGPTVNKLHLNFKSLPVTARTITFKIKKFYVVTKFHLSAVYGSQNKQ